MCCRIWYCVLLTRVSSKRFYKQEPPLSEKSGCILKCVINKIRPFYDFLNDLKSMRKFHLVVEFWHFTISPYRTYLIWDTFPIATRLLNNLTKSHISTLKRLWEILPCLRPVTILPKKSREKITHATQNTNYHSNTRSSSLLAYFPSGFHPARA